MAPLVGFRGESSAVGGRRCKVVGRRGGRPQSPALRLRASSSCPLSAPLSYRSLTSLFAQASLNGFYNFGDEDSLEHTYIVDLIFLC